MGTPVPASSRSRASRVSASPARQIAEHDLEAIAVEMPNPQLVLVPAGGQDPHPLDGGRLRPLRVHAEHAEPLPGGRAAILHARVADVAGIHPQDAREPVHRLERGQVLLLDPEVRVLPLARRQVGRDLLDDEGLRAGNELGHRARS